MRQIYEFYQRFGIATEVMGASFRNAMATEKLAEGIRAFCADAVKLEQLIHAA